VIAGDTALDFVELRKRFGQHEALKGISTSLRPGVTALLGPNGAGKSTLMHIIATISSPTSGEVRWRGERLTSKNIDRFRRELGYVPQQFAGYPQLTVGEFIRYIGRLRGLSSGDLRGRVERSIESFALQPFVRTRMGACSPGTLQRVALAQALIADPTVLLLDEPTAGVDPNNRNALGDVMRDAGKRAIVLVCTHILSDLDGLATRAIVLEDGRLASDSPTNFESANYG